MDLTPLLTQMVEKNASDLFLSVGAPPVVKVEGRSHALGEDPLDQTTVHQLCYSVMNDDQTATYEAELELNLALDVKDVGRFRVNVFRQRGEPALVARFVKSKIPTLDALGLPPILLEVVMEQRGLVLVVGATGTGKSTTLAAMIDHRAETREGHILTVEDPIEFIYRHKKSLVNQREVGIDTLSYTNALKNAMREAPDVILIGEIRDEETMRHAINYAQTGHLCLSTLHANNANKALDRILNFFPAESQAQILPDIALHLRAIISQRLIIAKDGSRVAAVEVMLNTPYIADLIERGKIDEIKGAMEKAMIRGCQTFDNALYELWRTGRTSEEEVLKHADSRNNLALKIRMDNMGRRHEMPPIKKEITYDETAPFADYKSYRVSPVKVQSHRPDSEKRTTIAIDAALKGKGMTVETVFPHIDVQYAFGSKVEEEVKQDDIKHEVGMHIDVTPPSKVHSMLIVNIVDTRTREVVWRMKSSRESTELEELTQEQVNELMAELFGAFPPG